MNNCVLLEELLIKKSQQKRRTSPSNFKVRFFVLTKSKLAYYEHRHGVRQPFSLSHNRVMEGRIKVVKRREGLTPSCPAYLGLLLMAASFLYSPLQIVHDSYILYVFAPNRESRQRWVFTLKEEIRNNNSLVSKCHPDFWIDGKWRCCAQTEKMAPGCVDFLDFISASKKPLPPTPEDNWVSKLLLDPKDAVVMAIYDYEAQNPQELTLQYNEEYYVIDISFQQPIYKSFVTPVSHSLLLSHSFCIGKALPFARLFLFHLQPKFLSFFCNLVFIKENILFFSTDNNPVIKHYHINETTDFPKRYYLAEKHVFDCIPELINYHQHNAAGLVTRLRYAVSSWRKKAPITAGLSYGKLVINPSELTRVQEIGSGQFGVVYLGYLLEKTKVAIKTIREGAMSEEDFIEEAKVLMKLSHPKLVQLYGVCFENTPICLVFEFMENGCLSDYLRSQRGSFSKETLLGMCQDVCEGMAYLEQNSVIHRDLAARNCLVGESHVVKVSDFGMSRIVLDDQYTSSTGTKFPVKWSAPEVFSYSNYSTKSDVWSFGVLMWEVFSEGKIPYENRTNGEVVEEINAGFRLYKPKLASKAIYEVMSHCWRMRKDDRPSFSVLLYQLSEISEFDL
uniref:non-specific protein-tyrosine kinase n=1 Tax=Bubo bubo TaxID=30461 RepID=A0A8C0ERY5_BUBBB